METRGWSEAHSNRPTRLVVRGRREEYREAGIGRLRLTGCGLTGCGSKLCAVGAGNHGRQQGAGERRDLQRRDAIVLPVEVSRLPAAGSCRGRRMEQY